MTPLLSSTFPSLIPIRNICFHGNLNFCEPGLLSKKKSFGKYLLRILESIEIVAPPAVEMSKINKNNSHLHHISEIFANPALKQQILHMHHNIKHLLKLLQYQNKPDQID